MSEPQYAGHLSGEMFTNLWDLPSYFLHIIQNSLTFLFYFFHMKHNYKGSQIDHDAFDKLIFNELNSIFWSNWLSFTRLFLEIVLAQFRSIPKSTINPKPKHTV